MDAFFLAGQAIVLCALAYGCYLCITNWHLSDRAGIEREFRFNSRSAPSRHYEPMDDSAVAPHIGFLL